MTGPSKSKVHIEDLENQLISKNKDLTEKYLELGDLLDLTNTINSLDDLDSLSSQLSLHSRLQYLIPLRELF